MSEIEPKAKKTDTEDLDAISKSAPHGFTELLKQLIEEVDPEYVRQAFEAVIEKQAIRPGKAGRRPFRMQQIWEQFKGCENEGVLLDALATLFKDTPRPASYAQTFISKLNESLVELGYDLEVKRVVSYHIRRRTAR
jgi:hypothetical protein